MNRILGSNVLRGVSAAVRPNVSCVGNMRTLATRKQDALAPVYNSVFRSSLSYVTLIIVGGIVLEGVYGSLTNFVWENVNRGRLYHHIDWSKFKTEDDDEEEDE